MSEITIIDRAGMFLEEYDDIRASFTCFNKHALKFRSMAAARRTAKELNERYGWRKLQVSYT